VDLGHPSPLLLQRSGTGRSRRQGNFLNQHIAAFLKDEHCSLGGLQTRCAMVHLIALLRFIEMENPVLTVLAIAA
jgi:hypothetical protein